MSTNNNQANGEVSVTEPTQVEILTKKISDFLKQTGLQFSYEEDEKFVTFRYDFSHIKRLIVFINKNMDGTVNNYVVQLIIGFSVTFEYHNIEWLNNSRFESFKELVNYTIKNENGE
jgi:hypothetical protein